MGKDGDVEVSFMRKHRKSIACKFVLPNVPDLASVNIKDIKAVLPPLKVSGQTARQQSFYSFEMDLRNFENMR